MTRTDSFVLCRAQFDNRATASINWSTNEFDVFVSSSSFRRSKCEPGMFGVATPLKLDDKILANRYALAQECSNGRVSSVPSLSLPGHHCQPSTLIVKAYSAFFVLKSNRSILHRRSFVSICVSFNSSHCHFLQLTSVFFAVQNKNSSKSRPR
jgi:hypothetical protein